MAAWPTCETGPLEASDADCFALSSARVVLPCDAECLFEVVPATVVVVRGVIAAVFRPGDAVALPPGCEVRDCGNHVVFQVLLQDQRDWLTARWSRAAGGAAPEPRRVRDHVGPAGRAFQSGTASVFADPAECADFDGEGEAARWYRSKNALFIPLLAEAGGEGALGVVVFSNRLHDDQQTPTPELADELAMTAEDDAALRDEVTYVAPGDAMRTIYATPFSPRDEAALAGFVDFLGLVYAFTQRNNDKGQRSENSRVAAHKRERRKSRDDIRDRSLSKFVDGVEWASTATELFGADAFGSLRAAPARAPPEVARAFARWKAAS